MPKLKQPVSLKKMSSDVLLECALRCCNQLSAQGSPEDVRHGIFLVKENVCTRLPTTLLARFCNRFLHQFYVDQRPMSHRKAALEIILDEEIVGLRCDGPILRCLHVSDAHRLKGLEILDMGYHSARALADLGSFDLGDLTAFICYDDCNDRHLDLIGRNCPKLKTVKVSGSSLVTDEGMRALSRCPELRAVDVVGCPGISQVGLTHLLCAHENLEEISYGNSFEDGRVDFNADVLSGLDWSLKSPSVTHFVFQNHRDVRLGVNLQAIATKFPNLVHLQINCMHVENLTALRSLDKLTGLEINFVSTCFLPYDIAGLWLGLRELLTFIGTNITTLKVAGWNRSVSCQQNELNFIFDACPNIERLQFDLGNGVLVIPPFPKLKELWPSSSPALRTFGHSDCPVMKIGKMVSLETLSLREFPANLSIIESMMLDDDKFPNLTLVETIGITAEELMGIERIAKNNNLDFKVNNDPGRHHHHGIVDDNWGTIDEADMTTCRRRFDRADLLVIGADAGARRR